MKKCPQCGNLFEDDLLYCTHDGTPLVGENLPLPSDFSANPPDDEEPTVIHHEPIIVEIPPSDAPPENFTRQIPPNSPNAAATAPIVVVRNRNTNKYFLFLVLGLLLGGGLVLATLFLAGVFNRSKNTSTADNTNSNTSVAINKGMKTQTPEPRPDTSKHRAKTATDDAEFNGRVISLNAYVRASPNRNSAETDVLPIGDRLTIMNRDGENSPWFFVACEHGTSGWMHGNTIEYTR